MRFLLTVACASHLPQPLLIPHCCLAYVMPHFWSRSGVVVIGLFRVFIFWYHARRFAATIGRDTTMNGIQALKTIPDPRRRRGRHYPLFGLLAIVLRAAMHGERS